MHSRLPLRAPGLCRFLGPIIIAFLCTLKVHAATNLNVKLISNLKPSPNPLSYGDVWAEGDLACLGVWLGYSSYNYGVGIISISNPAAPVLLSVYSPNPTSQNQFELGALRNRIGYFGSWSGGGLHIVSLTNPAAPALLCRIGATTGNVTNGFDRVHTIWLERNFLYEAAHVAGITTVKVFDVSIPSAPVFLQNIQTTNTTKVHQITVRNKGAQAILYTSGWGGNSDGNPASPGQTDIFDVSNVGTQPAQWLGRIYSGYNSHSSYPTPDGNTLIICRETPGGDVKFYDISNPAAVSSNAVPLVTLTPASMGIEADIPHNPVVVSNLLFLSWYQNGIQVFDIADRSRPVRVGFLDTYPAAQSSSYQGNWGVFPHLGLDKLLLSDIQSGMFILDATSVLTPTNNYPPLIVAPPLSLTATQGLSAVFSPIITGSLLNYQWRLNGTNLPGRTEAMLTLNNVQPNQAGNYSVLVSNASGMATSAVATLSVVASGLPVIHSHPQNVSVYPDEPVNFSVGVAGAAPLSFQWRFNGNDIPGATSNTFTIAFAQPEQVGFYSVQVSNSYGVALSSNALLTLLDSPYVSSVRAQPGARSALIAWATTVPSSSQVQFDVAATIIQNPSSLAAAAQASFGSSSYIDSRLTTNHLILLTGLAPDTRYSFQVLSVADTNTYVSGVYQFVTAGTIVLDNPSATFTGSWTTNNTSTDKYSSNYVFAPSTSGAATAAATFRPNITTPGKYDVYVWYPQGSNRANNAPYTISYSGGSTTVFVNQQGGGGAWQLIGAGLDFAKGTNGFVRLANNANPGVVIADAVRFTYVESQDFPTTQTVPTWWEDFFFGGPTDPTTDADGDGYSTAQEYVMGTSPVDGTSYFQFQGSNNGNSVSVSFWPYLGNRSYQLLSRADIAAAGWQALTPASIISTPEGTGIFSLSLSNVVQSFFRLRVEMSANATFSGSIAVPAGRSFSSFASDPICGPNRAYLISR